ncbi:GntR family transcriptional regulator [Mesoflavibacter sp. HG96]|uniref:aminotransferase-like domain-containing protein n=1 Tax=unclassified Mesoflavibacter TaxID=2630131 RepID=UPI000D1037FC|nr:MULTISPECIES: PLP-dependent aminotransferase family protein [unclassified Mesoflavibacter]QIJ89073.1 GntR family transcriptional regulator [Mesoflavibacter sp. HG96]QIJ91801.1 GntR family transcriptional regulator [Mesoflavibacter sp. HG37]
MNSPVEDILLTLTALDNTSVSPKYIQIAQQVINAIQRGYLTEGTKLPGTRKFGELLGVNRNTVVAVYDELASQGWVDIVANKGTFVLMPEKKTAAIKGAAQGLDKLKTYPETTGFSFQSSFNLASTEENSECTYVVNDGQPDLRLHPTHQFSRWYSASMKRPTLVSKWNQTQDQFYSIFNKQLCNYLNATRGFYIMPHNILSTRSTEMSLYIVSQLLIKKNDVVLVAQLSPYKSNMIFQQAGANLITIPVDHNGIDVDFIEQHFTKNSIRCVYVCAHRQYPTTVTLSAERRVKLLQLAKAYNFAIIEDDFDYDFQFNGSAMLPMASADSEGVVIYLGRLGQSFFPSFQIGFLIAPQNVIKEANNYLQLLDKQGDLIQKQMLSELIAEGEINRLIKKNITVYKQRRDYLSKCLTIHFKDIATWKIPDGGLAIWLEFKMSISLFQLAEKAKANNLFLPKTILYQNKSLCAIRLGFGHLNEDEIETVVKILKQSFDAVRL